jgi:nucleosome binding factor SPN SPT16 subunit
VKPTFGARKKGSLKFYKSSNSGKVGFEYISEAGDIVLQEGDVAHCVFIRNHGMANTVLQLNLNVSYSIGTKETNVIQFFHEGGRKSNPRAINFTFKRFVMSFKDKVKFTTDVKPNRKLEFDGVVEQENTRIPVMVKLQPTPTCLLSIALAATSGDTYIPLNQVVVAMFERVKVSITFDLVLVMKYDNGEFWDYHFASISKKNLEPLQEWLSETNTEWFQQTACLSWDEIIKHVEQKGYDEFIKTEGWAKLLEPDQATPTDNKTKNVSKNNNNNTNNNNNKKTQVQTRQEESSRPKREASKGQPQTIATLGDDSSSGSDFSAGSDQEEEEEEDDIEESDD